MEQKETVGDVLMRLAGLLSITVVAVAMLAAVFATSKDGAKITRQAVISRRKKK